MAIVNAARAHRPATYGDSRWRYDAFLSYRRTPDASIASALQVELQRFAKPFYKRRVLRLFRDTTTVPLTEEVWPPIREALAASGHFLLLASPAAAESEWVRREVEEWMRLHGGTAENLLIVLTDGEIVWDVPRDRFDWERTSALPRVLDGVYRSLPNYIDMRWARTSQDLSTRNPQFLEAVATIASALRGVPKDDLVGVDVREHRRFVRARNATAGALVLLGIGLFQATMTAIEQFQLTRSQLEATYVANGAAQVENGRPALALPWYLQALTTASDRPWYRHPFSPSKYNAERLRTHRFRLAALMGYVPVPLQLWALEERVTAAHLTPDGRYVAVLTDGAKDFDHDEGRWKCGRPGEPRCRGTLRVFDAQGGPNVASIPHAEQVVASALAPSGALLATVSAGGTVRLWSLPAARLLWSDSLPAVDSPTASVTFSTDESRLVVSTGGLPVAWALSTRALTKAPPSLEGMSHVGSDADARRHLLADTERALVWEIDSGRTSSLTLPAGFTPFGIGALSPDGQVAALSGTVPRILPSGTFGTTEQYVLALVDVDGRTQPRLLNHPFPATSAVFDASGERVLTTSGMAPEGGSSDGGARLWSVPDGRLLADGMERPPLSAATLGPNSQTVVVASDDGTATLWTPPETADETRSKLRAVLEHGGVVTRAELSRDGRRVLTVDEANLVRLWLLPPGEDEAEFGPFQAAPAGRPHRGKRRLSARVGRRRSGEEVRLLALNAPTDLEGDTLQEARVSEDGTFAVTWNVGGTAMIWSTRTGRPLLDQPIAHPGGVLLAAISPDGSRVATGGFDHTARLWDARTGRLAVRALRHPGSGAEGQMNVYFIGGGDRLVTVDFNAADPDAPNARMWDVESGELLGVPFQVRVVDERAPVDTLLAANDLAARWPGLVSWPADDFRALAELAAGHRVDAVGNLVALDSTEIRDRWRQVRARATAAAARQTASRGGAVGRSPRR
ncbi:MAG TPA: hypothetical protein VIB55_01435 [Longimicrobium sp.]